MDTSTIKNQSGYFKEVLALYPHEDVVQVLPEHLGYILNYYKEGDSWHRRHFPPTDRTEYNELIEFMKEFRETAESMCIEEEVALIIQNEFLKVNLNPWIKFVEKHGLQSIFYQLGAIKGRAVLYINQDNISDFKYAFEVLERIEQAIIEMIFKSDAA